MGIDLKWVDLRDRTAIDVIRDLFLEYQTELGIDLCFQGFKDELASLPGVYAPPKGALMLVSEGELPLGCGALRDLGDSVAELKRIYVRPSYRGKGLGRSITYALLEEAKRLDYLEVKLDTLRRLESAVSLYRSLGFFEVAPYNFNPEPDIVYMQRSL